MEFCICITTIKQYKVALDILIDSLPIEWKNKYILIYQNETENNYKIFEDGHIEVYITNNIYDYGCFVGLDILLNQNIINTNTWVLCIHDTCKFVGNNCAELTYKLIEQYNSSNIDILWLCNTGQCNICLIRENAIKMGNTRYKDIQSMTKMESINYEHNFKLFLSPKSFNVQQFFINNRVKDLGRRCVYNNVNERVCLLYESINMEKYFYHYINYHPFSP